MARGKHQTESRKRQALILALLIAFSSALEAATVRGQIIHRGGLAARYVAVRVVSQSGAASPFGHTGDDGWYYLNSIPAGQYTLEVSITNDNVVRLPVSVHEQITDVQRVEIP